MFAMDRQHTRNLKGFVKKNTGKGNAAGGGKMFGREEVGRKEILDRVVKKIGRASHQLKGPKANLLSGKDSTQLIESEEELSDDSGEAALLPEQIKQSNMEKYIKKDELLELIFQTNEQPQEKMYEEDDYIFHHEIRLPERRDENLVDHCVVTCKQSNRTFLIRRLFWENM